MSAFWRRSAATQPPHDARAGEVDRGAFDAFIARTRAAGFVVTPDQAAAAYAILLLFASGNWRDPASRLPTLLTPILAQDRAQQETLRRQIADEAATWLRGTAGHTAAAPAGEDAGIGRAQSDATLRVVWSVRWTTILIFIAALAVAAGGAVALAHWWPVGQQAQPPPPPPPPHTVDATPPAKATTAFRQLAQPAPHVVEPVSTQYPLLGSYLPSWTGIGIYALASLPLALLGAAMFAAYRRRRKWSDLARADTRDISEIAVARSAIPLFESEGVLSAGRDLARPRRMLIGQIDVDRSVDASVRAAGVITLVPPVSKATQEYVVLIEEYGRHDHIARLSDIAANRLVEAGVLVERYYVASPGQLRDRAGRSIAMHDLAARHTGDRLIVLGSGDLVIDPQNDALPAGLSRSSDWNAKAFIVAGAIDRRTAAVLMQAGFLLSVATRKALAGLGDQFASNRRDNRRAGSAA